MTIRSGGRPREPRPPHARPYEPDAYATDYIPEDFEPSRRTPRRRGNGGHHGDDGNGMVGLVKFLIFALVLGGGVLIASLTVLRPVLNAGVLAWASDNPGAWDIEFVAEIVRDDIGTALTEPASSDSTQTEFIVEEGDTATSIADRLEEEGFLIDSRAFVFIAMEEGLTGDLQQGTFVLRKNMTPDEIVTALLAPEQIPVVSIDLRTGLRLEQITAKLQTIEGLEMDVREFYELASEPPASLIADYPWLQTARAGAPEGASLEGYLWPAEYVVLPDTTAEELIRLMLDGFIEAVGEERLTVPEERGLTFHQVLALASIVEREAVLDEEKPIIAGVYQNRIDEIPGVAHGLLQADPTVIYAADTVNLDALEFLQWQEYVFWAVPEAPMAEVVLPEELSGYNTYVIPGLPPGPIATPTVASIDAALAPDTAEGYIYFLAIPDGGGAHVFSTTLEQHDAYREEYGYS